jgi:hypothetical protein
MKLKNQPDVETIGRVLKLEWKLTDTQVDDVIKTFFWQGAHA